MYRPSTKTGSGSPVVQLLGEVVTALQQQDPLAGRRERVRQGAAARTGSDNDDVELVRHSASRMAQLLLSRLTTRACSGVIRAG